MHCCPYQCPRSIAVTFQCENSNVLSKHCSENTEMARDEQWRGFWLGQESGPYRVPANLLSIHAVFVFAFCGWERCFRLQGRSLVWAEPSETNLAPKPNPGKFSAHAWRWPRHCWASTNWPWLKLCEGWSLNYRCATSLTEPGWSCGLNLATSCSRILSRNLVQSCESGIWCSSWRQNPWNQIWQRSCPSEEQTRAHLTWRAFGPSSRKPALPLSQHWRIWSANLSNSVTLWGIWRWYFLTDTSLHQDGFWEGSHCKVGYRIQCHNLSWGSFWVCTTSRFWNLVHEVCWSLFCLWEILLRGSNLVALANGRKGVCEKMLWTVSGSPMGWGTRTTSCNVDFKILMRPTWYRMATPTVPDKQLELSSVCFCCRVLRHPGWMGLHWRSHSVKNQQMFPQGRRDTDAKVSIPYRRPSAPEMPLAIVSTVQLLRFCTLRHLSR